MVNEKMRQMMQEALDDVLPEELRQELDTYLDANEEEVQYFNRLNRVDHLMSAAPFERAPRRLAATIMARLAENLEAQQQAQSQSEAELEISREVVAVALALVTVATMPLLVAASWMVVNSMADPSLLTAVLQQIVGLLLLVLEMLQVFLEKAQELAESDPNAAMALLALIPVTLLAMVRYMLDEEKKG